ncbi:hypothetical protein LCGC14_1541510, partial [marine sediment metagenome]
FKLFSIKSLFEEFNTKDMLGVQTEKTAEKCLNDCMTTWRLYHYFNKYLTDNQWECYEVDRKLIHILREVEKKGLALRQVVLEEHDLRLRQEILDIKTTCDLEGGFNPGSPQQVGMVLAMRGNTLPFTGRSYKRLKTGEEVLELLTDPLAATILDYRRKSKLLSTYVKPWLGKERAYTHFRLDLATGRLASGSINNWDDVNRNLQNIPKPMREIFRPDNKVWTWMDYSQIELRVLAWMSKDKTMMEEYAKAKPDLHQITADAGGVDRPAGKTFNFAMVFGANNKMLARKTGVDIKLIPDMRDAWGKLYLGAQSWINNQQYSHNGEWVESDFGRRMRLPEPAEGNIMTKGFAAHVGKCAINYPIQGTAADIVKRGMIKVYESGADLRLQIHDEYLVDGLWTPEPSLANIHPEMYTPFETKSSPVWSLSSTIST